MRRLFFSTALLITSLAMTMVQAQRPYRSTYQSTRQLILRIESRSANFRTSVQEWTDQNPSETYGGNDINLFAGDFEAAVRN